MHWARCRRAAAQRHKSKSRSGTSRSRLGFVPAETKAVSGLDRDLSERFQPFAQQHRPYAVCMFKTQFRARCDRQYRLVAGSCFPVSALLLTITRELGRNIFALLQRKIQTGSYNAQTRRLLCMTASTEWKNTLIYASHSSDRISHYSGPVCLTLRA